MVEEVDDRGEHRRETVHRARERGGDPLGVREGEPLRHELADDHREVGDDRHHDEEGDVVGGHVVHPGDHLDPDGERLGDPGPAKSAGQGADKRDPDLDGRKKFTRREREVVGELGPVVALVGKGFQLRLAGGNERDLGHREDAVRQEQDENKEDFECESGHISNPQAYRMPARGANGSSFFAKGGNDRGGGRGVERKSH